MRNRLGGVAEFDVLARDRQLAFERAHAAEPFEQNRDTRPLEPREANNLAGPSREGELVPVEADALLFDRRPNRETRLSGAAATPR